MRADPDLRRPAGDRARGVGLPGRPPRQHRREPAVPRPAWSERFFMRVRFEGTARAAGPRRRSAADFAAVAARFGMQWELWDTAAPYRTLLMVSQHLHCLNDLLFRWSTGSLNIEIPAIVSPTTATRKRLADTYGLEFHHIPVTPDTKPEAERRLAELADDARRRPDRAGPLHADPQRRPVPALVGADHQHPPLVPAELQGRQALPPGLRARGEAGRRDRPLRHRRPRRGPDHRAGRAPGRPQPRRRTSWSRPAATSRRRCSPAPSAGTPSPGCS